MSVLQLESDHRVSAAQVVEFDAATLGEALGCAAVWAAAHDDGVLTVVGMRADYFHADGGGPERVTVAVTVQGCERPGCCTPKGGQRW